MFSKKSRFILIGSLIVAATILGFAILALTQESHQSKSFDTSTQAPDSFFSLETSDCALPCLLGITPGETDGKEAIATASIYASTLPPEGSGRFDIQCEKGNCIHVQLNAPDPRLGNYISSITLIADYPGKLTTLGELLDRGYTPQRIFLKKIGGPNAISLTILFTGDANLIASVVGDGEISSNSQIDYLIIVADQEVEKAFSDISAIWHLDRDVEIPWIGYASRETYYNTPSIQPK